VIDPGVTQLAEIVAFRSAKVRSSDPKTHFRGAKGDYLRQLRNFYDRQSRNCQRGGRSVEVEKHHPERSRSLPAPGDDRIHLSADADRESGRFLR